MNRLLGVRPMVVLNRDKILSWRGFGAPDVSFSLQMYGPPTDWTKDDLMTMMAVMAAPTPEEAADIALIDAWFSRWLSPALASLKKTPVDAQGMAATFGIRLDRVGAQDKIQAILNNPFWNPKPAVTLPRDKFGRGVLSTIEDSHDLAQWGYFGIPPDRNLPSFSEAKWGETKPYVKNAIAFLEAIKDYPFPQPIPLYPSIVFFDSKNDIREIIRQPMEVSKDVFRFWLTLYVAQYYDTFSTQIQEHFNDLSGPKWKRLVTQIGMMGAFAVMTMGLGMALAPAMMAAGAAISGATAANVITSALQMALTIEQKKAAADGMVQIAELFAQSDAGYSNEARMAGDILSIGLIKESGPKASELYDAYKLYLDNPVTHAAAVQAVGGDPAKWNDLTYDQKVAVLQTLDKARREGVSQVIAEVKQEIPISPATPSSGPPPTATERPSPKAFPVAKAAVGLGAAGILVAFMAKRPGKRSRR